MKLKHLLVAGLILIVISAGIVAFVKFVYNSPSNTENQGNENSDNDPETIELTKQIDALDKKFDEVLKKWTDNWNSSVNTLRALKEIIEELDKLGQTNTKVQNLDEYNNLRTKAVDKFISTYEYAFTSKLSYYIFWCDWDEAQRLTKESYNDIVPKSLLKDKRMIELSEGFEKRITSARTKQSDVSEEVTEFIGHTYELTESSSLSKLTDEEILSQIKNWFSELSEFSTKITHKDSDFLYPRLISAFTKLENMFFDKCDISKNSENFAFATLYFPLSNELLKYVEEHLTDSNENSVSNIMKMVRKLRQDFMAFGPINHFFTSRLITEHFNDYSILVDYLAFLCQFVTDRTNSDVLQMYLMSWFNGITFAVTTNTKYENEAGTNEILNALIIKSAISNIFDEALSAKGFEDLEVNYDLIRNAIKADVNNLAAKSIDPQDYSLYEIARMYLNASVMNAEDALQIVADLFDAKLKTDIERINSFESKARQNVEYVKVFTTIDILLSSLEYSQSPKFLEVGNIIKKYYNDELQNKVIEALRYDEETIAELVKTFDEPCNPYFAGFIADLYNRILLGLKGENEVSQELVNENRNLFIAHYKAYLTFAKMMKEDKTNTFFDALVFTRLYGNVSKMSLIDGMLKANEFKRKNLLTSLESKNRKNQGLIENLRTVSSLFVVHSAIADIPANWESWHDFIKIKSHVLKIKMSNTENQYSQLGARFVEDMLIRKLYEILINSFEEQQNETWVSRAKWLLGNFTLDSIKKNIIDEKLKILIK